MCCARCKINTFTTVVDANKCKMYMKNFGEFFNDQIETAACIIFSHVDVAGADKLQKAVELVRSHNAQATIVTTPYSELSGKDLLSAMEHSDTLSGMLEELKHSHHDDDDDEDEEHEHGECCHHHHHHDDEDEEHEHGECCHHHHHDEDEDEHEHHHHHHHADEVFTSWGVETSKAYEKAELEKCLAALSDAVRFGTVLRAKGIVPNSAGGWIHFDYVPGETEIRDGGALYTGRLCVIGSKLDEDELKELFGV